MSNQVAKKRAYQNITDYVCVYAQRAVKSSNGIVTAGGTVYHPSTRREFCE